jgi:hypothetical protein
MNSIIMFNYNFFYSILSRLIKPTLIYSLDLVYFLSTYQNDVAIMSNMSLLS